jgi:hypothetical protein
MPSSLRKRKPRSKALEKHCRQACTNAAIRKDRRPTTEANDERTRGGQKNDEQLRQRRDGGSAFTLDTNISPLSRINNLGHPTPPQTIEPLTTLV